MIQLRLSPGHSACCVQNLAAVAALAIARSPAASVATVCATPLCQTWRKGSFERRSANEPHSWHTPSMNARSATYVTSASEDAPSAIIFAESWGWAVPARIASSRSCSAISWTWRSSPDRNLGTVLIHRNRERGRDMTPCSHRAWTTRAPREGLIDQRVRVPHGQTARGARKQVLRRQVRVWRRSEEERSYRPQ